MLRDIEGLANSCPVRADRTLKQARITPLHLEDVGAAMREVFEKEGGGIGTFLPLGSTFNTPPHAVAIPSDNIGPAEPNAYNDCVIPGVEVARSTADRAPFR